MRTLFEGGFYLRADTINFRPWKSADTIQGCGRENVTCTIIMLCMVQSAAITITIDAHMVTSGSRGGHYLRVDTIPFSQIISAGTIQRADTIKGNTVVSLKFCHMTIKCPLITAICTFTLHTCRSI